jgi:hypothetical protein
MLQVRGKTKKSTNVFSRKISRQRIPPPLKFLYENIFLMNRHENTIKNAVDSLKYEEIKGK